MKIQKTKYGYTFGMIKKRMKLSKTMGGEYINIINIGHGMFVTTFRVKFVNAGLIELNNSFGTAPIFISK